MGLFYRFYDAFDARQSYLQTVIGQNMFDI